MTVEEKAEKYSNSEGIYNEHGERLPYMGYLAGYAEAIKDLSENKFNPDDYECLAGVCPDLSDEEHCENCSLKRLKK